MLDRSARREHPAMLHILERLVRVVLNAVPSSVPILRLMVADHRMVLRASWRDQNNREQSVRLSVTDPVCIKSAQSARGKSNKFGHSILLELRS